MYDGKTQIGFARLIKDHSSFAYLCDVFVVERYRGKGLGKCLMASVHAHPDLQGLRRWMLATRDVHGLYAQFCWEHLKEDQCKRFMQYYNQDVYAQ